MRLARCPLCAFSDGAPEETRRLSDYKSTRASCERSAGDVLGVQSLTSLQSALCDFKRVKQVGKALCVSARLVTHAGCLDQFRE